MIPIDIETAKAVALKAAKKHPSIDFRPNHVSIASISHPYFIDYYFFYVWGPLAHSYNALFAVGRDGSVFMLPDEFSRMAKDSGLLLTNTEEAQSLVELYLSFNLLIPDDSHVILADILDIPGIDSQKEIINQYRSVIRPMKITHEKEGWTFDFFSWRTFAGVLYHWNISITRFGEIRAKEAVIDRRIGDFKLML